MTKVTSKFIWQEIEHWINTLTNAYLGSNYGIDLKEYLQKPMGAFDGDEIIAKMRQDIPVLQAIDNNNLHIYFKKVSTDKILFYIQLNDGAKEYTVSL